MPNKKEKEQNNNTRKRIPFKRAVKRLLETPPIKKRKLSIGKEK